MSRLQAVNLKDVPELQGVFAAGKEIMGFVPNDALVMAHQPAILKAFLGLVQSIYAPGQVTDGLKRLIGLIVSGAAGCQYCQAHATNAAQQKSESAERIKAVWEFRTSPLFSPAEKAALEVAAKSAMIPNQTSDSDFDQLKNYYNAQEIVEIVSVISMYAFLNRWNSTFQTNIETEVSQSIEHL